MTAKKKKPVLTMEQLAKRAKKFLKDKEQVPNGNLLFDKAIKKAVKQPD